MERSYWNVKLSQIILSPASSDKRGEGVCYKRELIKRVLYEREGGSEGLFSFLKTEVKRHKSGQTGENKDEKRRGEKGRLLSRLRFTRLLPGYSWTVHLFRSFCLLHLSLETRGLDVVSLIFLTHYIIGAKTSGYFPRGSVFLSIPLSEMCVNVCWGGGEAVCLVSHVSESFHSSL